ncbi:hypothetical protein [Amycolatopsis vancoresmycina]|uniref:Uncharacterized protein n=1 Tax=Amycolatopsis vancoresmycina DSM 44592 TaxID=1292037 RepID=R1IAZ8_9PSEU|nr:hypothetical protein [Amycolatopsis vancoresmycina]EOD67564.1 hypothetical protein H480_15806 [Amycolatopsis vancoresmycina DSM 44592]
MDPNPTAPRHSRWRRGIYAAWLVIPFTASQVWALLVLLRLAPLGGLLGQAFAVTLLGSVVAIWAGWRWTWQLGRDRDRLPGPAKTRIPT